MIDRKISIAPMMKWTDKHFRYLIRLMSKNVLLYTEMIPSGAILNGDRKRLLEYNAEEHPLAIQIGGSNLIELAECTKVINQYHYDEINLNLGCPSSRVQAGDFGACLMKEPQLVRDCLKVIKSETELPVTIKCRTGVDEYDSYQYFQDFIGTLADEGCDGFIIHARKALLKGLNPKKNRTVPPLQYDYVTQIKKDFPNLTFILNGGIQELNIIETFDTPINGIMIGREAYRNPYLFATVDNDYFNSHNDIITRKEILKSYTQYAIKQVSEGVPISRLTKHLCGLYQGCPRAKIWRRKLADVIEPRFLSVEP